MTGVASGPTCVASCIGSPTTSWAIASTKRRSNSPAIASSTMKRLAAIQLWPLLITRACTAVRDRRVEIGAGHHDEGIAAAQFQYALFDLPAGLRGHLPARGLAAGERDGL